MLDFISIKEFYEGINYEFDIKDLINAKVV